MWDNFMIRDRYTETKQELEVYRCGPGGQRGP